MCFDSGDYQIRIAGALLIYLVIDNDLILGFLNLDHPSGVTSKPAS
jgi:hypothetical protein